MINLEKFKQVWNSGTFKEEDHPRDADGKFTSGSGGLSAQQKRRLADLARLASKSMGAGLGGKSINKTVRSADVPDDFLQEGKRFLTDAYKKIKQRQERARGADPLESAQRMRQLKADRMKKAKPWIERADVLGWSEESKTDMMQQAWFADANDRQERLSLEQAANVFTVQAIADKAEKLGYKVERSPISESAYIDTGEGKIRISAHELPETASREYYKNLYGGKWKDEIIVDDWRSETLDGYIERLGLKEMTQEKTNSKQLPKVYYAKHLFPGIAKYDTEMVLVDVDAMKKMAPSFAGKPVFVGHDSEVAKFISGATDEMPENVDGYVADCFYNEVDGWLWSKIIITSDKGHQAVADGWRVSNAYIPTKFSGSGKQHNVDYDRKILDAEFTHLAVVDDPRYEEAAILTPEAFKTYQAEGMERNNELKNSKGNKPMLKFFKNKKEEVKSSEIDGETFVELQNGKTVTIAQMVNAVEEAEKEVDEKINMETEIEVGNEKMPLSELINRYTELTQKKNETDKKEEKENTSDEDEEKENETGEDDEKENMDDAGNDHDLEKEKQNAKKKNFDELKNAHRKPQDVQIVDTNMDQLERGKQRYGKS